jgi:hypothetical protein
MLMVKIETIRAAMTDPRPGDAQVNLDSCAHLKPLARATPPRLQFAVIYCRRRGDPANFGIPTLPAPGATREITASLCYRAASNIQLGFLLATILSRTE